MLPPGSSCPVLHRLFSQVLTVALLLGAITCPALGQTLLLEVRGGVGVGEIGQKDINLLDPSRLREINAELLLSIPNPATLLLPGELRPHLGASFGPEDGYVYAGLSWTFRAPVVPVFVEAGLGGAVQSDVLEKRTTRFGCLVQGQAQASVGFDVLPNVAVMGTVQHLRDLGLCGQPDNPTTRAGLRLGLRF